MMQHQKLRFKPAMVWEKEVSEFVRSRTHGWTLNAPCGTSDIGDIRLDIQGHETATEIGDLLIFRQGEQGIFDTVISDPPWKVQYYHRPRWFFRCVELAKVGGRIIYNATWIPTSRYAELEEIWVRQSTTFANVSVLSVFRKTAKVPEAELFKPKSEATEGPEAATTGAKP